MNKFIYKQTRLLAQISESYEELSELLSMARAERVALLKVSEVDSAQNEEIEELDNKLISNINFLSQQLKKLSCLFDDISKISFLGF